MRALIASAFLLTLPLAAQAEGYRPTSASNACRPGPAQFEQAFARHLSNVVRGRYVLTASARWDDGSAEEIIAAYRGGGDGRFCIVARRPLAAPAA